MNDFAAPSGRRGARHLVNLLALVACCVGLVYVPLLLSGETGLLPVLGGFLLLPFVFVAYRFPYLTIFLSFAVGPLFHELLPFLPENLRSPSLGFMRIRFFDPVLFGILAAIGIKLLSRDRRLIDLMARQFPIIILILAWLLMQLARSIGTYGINTLGEFRTYYQYIFLAPYIVVFVRTNDRQWRLFKLLIVMSFLFIAVGLVRGGWLWQFRISASFKWLEASGNLALVYGVVALFLATRRNLIRVARPVFFALLSFAVVLTIISSVRAVWMTSAVLFFLVILTGNLSARSSILFPLVGGFGFLLSAYMIGKSGLGTVAFIDERMRAFTAYGTDATASWRAALWADAIPKILKNPFLGTGLGHHFQLVGSGGQIVSTAPHNLFISIAFQIGIVGLLLFLWLGVQLHFKFVRMYRFKLGPRSRTIILTAVIVQVSAVAYQMVYGFELFTWLYIGLGLSTLCTLRQQQRHRSRLKQLNRSRPVGSERVPVGPGQAEAQRR